MCRTRRAGEKSGDECGEAHWWDCWVR
jgi:hypothetical protein